MANVWHCGFETTTATNGYEYDAITGAGVSSVATPTHGSGTAAGAGDYGIRSVRVLHPVAATSYFQHQFGVAGNTGTDWYMFTAVRWAVLPDAETVFFFIMNTLIGVHSIRITTAGVIKLYREDTQAQVGSDGPALATDTWYWIGVAYAPSTGALTVYLCEQGQALLPVITGTGNAGQATARIRLGMFKIDATNVTGEVYFDDCVVNNSAGTTNNVIPQETFIPALRPNAAGDFNECSAGDWSAIDEAVPDEGVTLAILDANGDRLDVNIEPFNFAFSHELVKFAGVWSRSRAATAASESWRRRFKSQASGTLLEDAADITHNDTTFRTNGDVAPLLPLVAQTDPQTAGLHLTYAKLAGAQIGKRAVDAAPDIETTQMWLYVALSRGAVMLNPAVVESVSALGLVEGPLLKVA